MLIKKRKDQKNPCAHGKTVHWMIDIVYDILMFLKLLHKLISWFISFRKKSQDDNIDLI